MLVTLLIFILVACIAFWLLQTYVMPALPAPFRVWFMAVCALIALVVLINIAFPEAINQSLLHR